MSYPDDGGGAASAGGAVMPVNQIVYTTNHTVAPDEMLIMFDTTGGDLIGILPPAASVFVNGMGNIYVLKKVSNDANAVQAIDPGGLPIDGLPTATASEEKGYLMLQSIGTGYMIIGRS